MARFVCVAKAILSINPDAQVSVVDNDPEKVTFENGTSEISVSDIKTAMTKLNVTLAWKELRTERNAKLQLSGTSYLFSYRAVRPRWAGGSPSSGSSARRT